VCGLTKSLSETGFGLCSDLNDEGGTTRDPMQRETLLDILRQFYLVGEEVKQSMEWVIKRLIKVGDGKCLWPWRFLWPDITALCSCDEHGGKMVDGEQGGEVRSETDEKGVFINMTTVLPAFGSVGLPWDTLWGQPRYPAAPQGC
jgi:hypothetical protein